MLFNSVAYAIFLPIVIIIYWLIPHRFRWIEILIASLYFYMSWNVRYVVLILATTFVSYISSILIEKTGNKRVRSIILFMSLVVCLGILFLFKYFNFISGTIADIAYAFSLKLSPITLKLVLPVGISFYTFQTLSYVIDVYRGTIEAEHHFGKYAAFITFFPQLVAGPIEKASHLLPQIKEEHSFDYVQATYGLKLMAWGYYKKLVVADNLSPYVSAIFNTPQEHQGFAFVLATFFFTIQIYCDFSGYSDIAIGTAKLMGFDLMTNFRSPYFSSSVKEFWNRWHISLSTWLKDYIYIPLGGNRVSKVRHNINLIITFLVSGLWHGANWTYVVWGGIHGMALVVEGWIHNRTKRKPIWIGRIITFIFCAFAWIFFVSDCVGNAVYVIMHSFTGISNPVSYLWNGCSDIGLNFYKLGVILCSIAILGVWDYCSYESDCIEMISSQNVLVRYLAYAALLVVIIFFRASVQADFVYFQF